MQTPYILLYCATSDILTLLLPLPMTKIDVENISIQKQIKPLVFMIFFPTKNENKKNIKVFKQIINKENQKSNRTRISYHMKTLFISIICKLV